MSLVQYSDSEDNDDNEAVQIEDVAASRPPPPPLPAAFHDLYSGAARVSNSDDPALHHGRRRAVPHVEGNWAAHVYLEWHPSRPAYELLTNLLERLYPHDSKQEQPEVHSLLHSDAQVTLPLHISLSATLVLRSETRHAFLDQLTAALRRTITSRPRGRREQIPLSINATGLRWFANQDGTRSFLVLQVKSANDEDPAALKKLQQCSNDIARLFGCLELYAQSEDVGQSFHISIAWCLGTRDDSLDEALTDDKKPSDLQNLRQMTIAFREVKVKLGKDVTSIPFHP